MSGRHAEPHAIHQAGRRLGSRLVATWSAVAAQAPYAVGVLVTVFLVGLAVGMVLP